jgi:peroxiredoxin (alkyl hydroperoxide reductase subunit C)
MVKVRKKIDDFEFEAYHNAEIKKLKLSDYKGKWLVLPFYPADFTFVCPTELEETADYYAVGPANWRPGKKALRPDLDLGGRI